MVVYIFYPVQIDFMNGIISFNIPTFMFLKQVFLVFHINTLYKKPQIFYLYIFTIFCFHIQLFIKNEVPEV